MKKARIVIMISGHGSNMEALIHAGRRGDFPAEIVGVVCDQPRAGGLLKAQNLGVATFTCVREDFSNMEAHESALLAILTRLEPDFICLAGYMRLMSASMIDVFAGRMLNIHPSLLPLFPGLDTHRRALEAGIRIAGCSVHVVTLEMDAGPLVAQAAVPVLATDDEASLKARILAAEHRLYPAALRQFLINKGYVPAISAAQPVTAKDAALFSYG